MIEWDDPYHHLDHVHDLQLTTMMMMNHSPLDHVLDQLLHQLPRWHLYLPVLLLLLPVVL
jgi:hypothetical protein